MKTLYYICAVLAFSQFIFMVIFDSWVYSTKKDWDLVMNIWANRHNKINKDLYKHQIIFLKSLCLLEKPLILIIVITLSLNLRNILK